MHRYSPAELIELATDRLDVDALPLGELRDLAVDVFSLAAELREALDVDLDAQDDFVDQWGVNEDEEDEDVDD